MTALRITDDTTRTDLLEAITNLSYSAARIPHVVGNATLRTPWDRQHERINALLDELECKA